jgi:hypothetical protein
MQLFVKPLTGPRRVFTVEVEQSWTVAQLKNALYDLEGIPTALMRVVFNGKLMNDDGRTLADFKVERDATLILGVRCENPSAIREREERLQRDRDEERLQREREREERLQRERDEERLQRDMREFERAALSNLAGHVSTNGASNAALDALPCIRVVDEAPLDPARAELAVATEDPTAAKEAFSVDLRQPTAAVAADSNPATDRTVTLAELAALGKDTCSICCAPFEAGEEATALPACAPGGCRAFFHRGVGRLRVGDEVVVVPEGRSDRPHGGILKVNNFVASVCILSLTFSLLFIFSLRPLFEQHSNAPITIFDTL